MISTNSEQKHLLVSHRLKGSDWIWCPVLFGKKTRYARIFKQQIGAFFTMVSIWGFFRLFSDPSIRRRKNNSTVGVQNGWYSMKYAVDVSEIQGCTLSQKLKHRKDSTRCKTNFIPTRMEEIVSQSTCIKNWICIIDWKCWLAWLSTALVMSMFLWDATCWKHVAPSS